MRLIKRFFRWKLASSTAILSAALVSMGIEQPDRALLSVPRIVSERISFRVDSATNQVLTVQSADSLPGEWRDLTNQIGTGALLEFSISLQPEARFFRMKTAVISPGPELLLESLILKAGEQVSVKLPVTGGTEPLFWRVNGVLPDGLSLSEGGILQGTPTADAAEHNENGRYSNIIIVQDSFTDPLSGAPAPRKATNTLDTLVRFSYLLNIKATRPNGPSLLHNCSICHSADFKPDVTADATALINVLSGSGAECGTDRPYISPPDASDSLLYEKLTSRNDCGERMPFDGDYFSDRQLARLARWIRELTGDDRD
jgi:hypothetical protein